MAKDFQNDPLFKVLKEHFRVNLFYKPTMIGTDIYYHVVLDRQIVIEFQMVATNFLVLFNIIPITTQYIAKTYDNLVKCLKEQTSFSVMIFRLGNTAVINDACVSHNVPIVHDDRFITIPKKLFNMYKRLYEKNQDMCGFYLLAINDDMDHLEMIETFVPDKNPITKEESQKKDMDVIKKVKEEKTIEEIKGITSESEKSIDEPINNNNYMNPMIGREAPVHTIRKYIQNIFPNMSYVLGDDDNKFTGHYNGLSISFYLNGAVLEILEMVPIDPRDIISGVRYMEFFTKIENLLNIISISVPNVSSNIVASVCQARNYPKIPNYNGTSSRGRMYGSFSVQKLK